MSALRTRVPTTPGIVTLPPLKQRGDPARCARGVAKMLGGLMLALETMGQPWHTVTFYDVVPEDCRGNVHNVDVDVCV